MVAPFPTWVPTPSRSRRGGSDEDWSWMWDKPVPPWKRWLGCLIPVVIILGLFTWLVVSYWPEKTVFRPNEMGIAVLVSSGTEVGRLYVSPRLETDCWTEMYNYVDVDVLCISDSIVSTAIVQKTVRTSHPSNTTTRPTKVIVVGSDTLEIPTVFIDGGKYRIEPSIQSFMVGSVPPQKVLR